jgi:hypothetical protein
VRVKRKLNTEEVDRLKGLTSLELADKCPDLRTVFPSTPCTNLGCEYVIRQDGYMNCTFVAAEASDGHTLEAIGEMMGITREGVRLIEARAMKKYRANLEALRHAQDQHDEAALHQSSAPAGGDRIDPDSEVPQLSDEHHVVRAVNG